MTMRLSACSMVRLIYHLSNLNLDLDNNSSFNVTNQNQYKNNMLDTSPKKKHNEYFGAK